jgi:hypothetical protein
MVEGVRALIVSGGHLLWAAPKQLPITWPRGTTYALDGILLTHLDLPWRGGLEGLHLLIKGDVAVYGQHLVHHVRAQLRSARAAAGSGHASRGDKGGTGNRGG